MKLFRWKQRQDEELNTEIQNHLDEAVHDRIERGESADVAGESGDRQHTDQLRRPLIIFNATATDFDCNSTMLMSDSAYARKD